MGFGDWHTIHLGIVEILEWEKVECAKLKWEILYISGKWCSQHMGQQREAQTPLEKILEKTASYEEFQTSVDAKRNLEGGDNKLYLL